MLCVRCPAACSPASRPLPPTPWWQKFPSRAAGSIYTKEPETASLLGLVKRLSVFTPVQELQHETDFEWVRRKWSRLKVVPATTIRGAPRGASVVESGPVLHDKPWIAAPIRDRSQCAIRLDPAIRLTTGWFIFNVIPGYQGAIALTVGSVPCWIIPKYHFH